MSSAFLVDNILNDKDDTHHHNHLSSDSDSDATSTDLKDSYCDSPINEQNITCDDTKLNLSEGILRTYNMIKENNCINVELCCAKCGYFQYCKKSLDDDDNPDFKCEKCNSCEFLHEKETILKESVTKPVLKFSVSAILDKKDCVKVRNGEFFFTIININQLKNLMKSSS